MKGMYINNKGGERDCQIVSALREEHELRCHRWLWAAREALEDEKGIEFIVTNMPYDDVSSRMMRIYSHLPPDEYYEVVYSQSFESLGWLRKHRPGIKLVVYTGADEHACIIAVAKYGVEHLIRKGRYDAKYEIDEIRKALAGEEYSPLWLKLGYARRMRDAGNGSAPHF